MTSEPDGITPSQTVGPFFHYALAPDGRYPFRDLFGADLAPPGVPGERIRIAGRVLDGDGEPVPDAMIEIWQADAAGRHVGPAPGGNAAFTGFGRAYTGPDGTFAFATVLPGAVPGPDGRPMARHVAVAVLGRGLLKRLLTRLYFEGEALEGDVVLAAVPEARRHTLIARRGPGGLYTFDIRLQGEDETVFFLA